MYVLVLLPWTYTQDFTLNCEYNKLDTTKQIAICLITKLETPMSTLNNFVQ